MIEIQADVLAYKPSAPYEYDGKQGISKSKATLLIDGQVCILEADTDLTSYVGEKDVTLRAQVSKCNSFFAPSFKIV